MNYLVRDREVIFNLAGQVSHIDSMRDPHTDLEINCRSQLTILEACRQHNPGDEGRVRRHAPDLRPAGPAAGRRDASRAPDRHQRHQQGRRRVLPPGLQQRVRRARLLAAADQRLRPAPADPAQPPGLHRLVHPPGARGRARSRSTATDRRCAISSTSTTSPTRSCARARRTPCNGDVFNVGGTRADRASRSREDAARRGRPRIDARSSSGPTRSAGSTSDRSTRTPRSSRATTGWTAGRRPARGPRPHAGVLPRALRPLRRAARRSRRRHDHARAVHGARARARRRRPCARRSTA